MVLVDRKTHITNHVTSIMNTTRRIKFNLMGFVTKVTEWLAIGLSSPKVNHQEFLQIRKLITSLSLIHNSRGEEFLILYCKEIRMVLMNYLSGSPITTSKLIRITKDGIPTILGDLIPTIRKSPSPEILRMLFTVLFSTRSLSIGTKVDTTPISNGPQSFMRIPEDMKQYVPMFWKDLGYRPPRKNSVPARLNWTTFHMSVKSGPTSKGGNALWTALKDLSLLPLNTVGDMCVLGGQEFSRRLVHLISNWDAIKRATGDILDFGRGDSIRRLHAFPDKENKVRVIALLDYFSQSCLKPLHHYLYSVLKKIPQDLTFDQSKFKEVLDVSDDTVQEKYWSIDLSNATDRFPIQVISMVLEGRFPSWYVRAWENLMISLPFDHDGNRIYYAVGNPMGAYSSWASFALAHHFVVYYCCKKLQVNWHTLHYSLLGDDIVIRNDQVGKLYQQTIRDLGVEFSTLKSHISLDFFEMAKRLFYKGQEVSAFPISALKESSKRYYLFTDLLMTWEDRGYKFTDGVTGASRLYYGMVKSLPSRVKTVLVMNCHVTELIMKVIRGVLPAGEGITNAIQELGISIPTLTDDQADNLLRNIAVELFSVSNPSSNIPSKRKSVGLGYLAESLLMRLLDPTVIDESVGVQTIECLPVLPVYGGIEETYVRLSQYAQTLKDWPLLLKTMALPWDDRVLQVKKPDALISGATGMMIPKLKERGEVLLLYPKLLLGSLIPIQLVTRPLLFLARTIVGPIVWKLVTKLLLFSSVRLLLGLITLGAFFIGYLTGNHLILSSILLNLNDFAPFVGAEGLTLNSVSGTTDLILNFISLSLTLFGLVYDWGFYATTISSIGIASSVWLDGLFWMILNFFLPIW
ncbi:RNA-dependent RNA polymerase [Albatrellopsis flettii mitovirus 1]|nr:RNA-dependent RNA polymerase [Albatrellopsis flettii mitovirus 1]